MPEQRDYTAFLMVMSHPDPDAAGNWVRTRFLAVKPSRMEALAAVRNKRKKPCTVEILGSGSDLMAEAERRGMTPGDLLVLEDREVGTAPPS